MIAYSAFTKKYWNSNFFKDKIKTKFSYYAALAK